MSDLMPKVKLFIFLSIFQIFINVGILLATLKLDLLALIGLTTGAFVPFVSLIGLAMSGFDPIVMAFIGVFTGIISALQTYLIVEIILSHIPFVDV